MPLATRVTLFYCGVGCCIFSINRMAWTWFDYVGGGSFFSSIPPLVATLVQTGDVICGIPTMQLRFGLDVAEFAVEVCQKQKNAPHNCISRGFVCFCTMVTGEQGICECDP